MLTDVSNTPPVSPLRDQCRKLGRIISIACLGLAGLLLLESLGPLAARSASGSDIGHRLINLMAPCCYLVALWHMGRVLKTFARQGRVLPTASDILKGIGISLAVGAIFQIFLVPLLLIAVGKGPGYFIALDGAHMVLGILGLGLWGLSRLFRRAARLERELDEII